MKRPKRNTSEDFIGSDNHDGYPEDEQAMVWDEELADSDFDEQREDEEDEQARFMS